MRSKAAIATLKGFLRGELKGDEKSGDVVFAKGIMAALEWLLNPDRPCPYVELEPDMGEDGGWEVTEVDSRSSHAPQLVQLMPVTQASPLITMADGAPPNPNAVKQLILPPGYATSEAEKLVDPSVLAAASNDRTVANPALIDAAVAQFPWLEQELRNVGSDISAKGGRLHSANTVIVGQGLNDEPMLSGGGGYD